MIMIMIITDSRRPAPRMRVLGTALAALAAQAFAASPAAAVAAPHHFFAAVAAALPPPGPQNDWYLARVTAMDRSLRSLAGRCQRVWARCVCV